MKFLRKILCFILVFFALNELLVYLPLEMQITNIIRGSNNSVQKLRSLISVLFALIIYIMKSTYFEINESWYCDISIALQI